MFSQLKSKTVVLIIILFTVSIYANLDTSFALRLYNLGLYEDARFEFERIDSEDYDNIDYYIAKCYDNSNELINSMNKYMIIIDNTNDYEILKSSALECAVIAISSGEPNLAIDCLERAITRGADIDTSNYILIKMIAENRWEELGIDPPSTKSPAIAQAMAVILPGSGQFYAGDLTNGLKSLGVNSVIWSIIIASVERGYYARAVAVLLLLAPNYWLGASLKAAEIAKEKNRSDYIRACRQALEDFECRKNR